MCRICFRTFAFSATTFGHGPSDAPKADHSIEDLGREVRGLADALKISEFAFRGLSLGGAIGIAADLPGKKGE